MPQLTVRAALAGTVLARPRCPLEDAVTELVPDVLSVRRDAVSREIRLELADWRTRTGGVYDLSPDGQEGLMLPGHLPGWGEFLPDFVIVLGTGDPVTVPGATGQPVESVAWRDLRVHVGGVKRSALDRSPSVRPTAQAVSAEWHSVDALLGRLPQKEAAPGWLLELLRQHTPWAHLLTVEM